MKADGKMRMEAAQGRGRCLVRTAQIRRSQAGQSLLEVALMLPMLMLLLLGAIEMGRYMYIYILLGNAARAGAGYGAQSLAQSTCPTPAPCGIQTAVNNDLNNGLDVTGLTVTASNSCGCDSGGTITGAVCDIVTNPNAGTCTAGHWVVMESVTVSGTFKALFGYPGIPSSIAVSRTATMRVAQR